MCINQPKKLLPADVVFVNGVHFVAEKLIGKLAVLVELEKPQAEPSPAEAWQAEAWQAEASQAEPSPAVPIPAEPSQAAASPAEAWEEMEVVQKEAQILASVH